MCIALDNGKSLSDLNSNSSSTSSTGDVIVQK